MTKSTLALAAALLAGTTLTNAANAGGIRVGFGFPLGSFVAHSTQSYAGDGYGYRRHCDKERYARRRYQAAAVRTHKAKHPRKVDVAEVKRTSAPVVKTAKLDDKLESNPATTTEIAKTSSQPAPAKSATEPTTTVSATPAATAPATEASKTEKIATVEKTSTDGKSDLKKLTSDVKQVCRRYSAAIAGLIDVPCNE
jgi:hypothetical protein